MRGESLKVSGYVNASAKPDVSFWTIRDAGSRYPLSSGRQFVLTSVFHLPILIVERMV